MQDWARLNHEYLMLEITQVVQRMTGQISSDNLDNLGVPPNLNPPPKIEQLCQLFGLSRFERSIVLLCAAIELHDDLAMQVMQQSPKTQFTNPTFRLALQQLQKSHWSALTPESPLRRWHLIELGSASSLMQSPLRISERVLHFLVGDQQLDPQLIGIVNALPIHQEISLPPSQQQLEKTIINLLQSSTNESLIQLCGSDSQTKQAIVISAAQKLGYGLLKITADNLPTDGNLLHLLHTLWMREALLQRSLLLLDCDHVHESTTDSAPPNLQVNAIARTLEACHCPMLIFSLDRRPTRQRSVFSFEVTQPTTTEQRLLWQQSLTSIFSNRLNWNWPDHHAQTERLVSHFNLSPLAIQTICQQALAAILTAPPSEQEVSQRILQHLWTACLSHARPKLEELAQPIRTQATWADLVLPDKERQILKTIVAQVRQRAKVYEQWGFAKQGDRGLGISALFAGASGTGKTLAAEVLANELHLDLYRIDLSSVVSKYIGETEKNLRRIFDAAEVGGSILLFDEADALFGKRSEVKDSHDRYANMEVAYLLQRMESYRGLAILTTNLKSSLDQAFLRRLRFVVQFPFPDATQRAEIWQRVFPKQTPTENLSYQKLAKLNVPGGNIRNIALNAAFLAADDNLPIQMQHILQSAQSEYSKLERPLTEAETKGWETTGVTKT
jgi:hypothetical protein